MPYFYLENHYGDDNDNAIRDVVIHAPDVDAMWSYIDSEARSQFDAGGAMYDGTDESHTCLYHSPDDYCPGEKEDGSPCGDECPYDHRMFHDDHYLISTHDTEELAKAHCQRWHGWAGTFHVDAKGKEVDAY